MTTTLTKYTIYSNPNNHKIPSSHIGNHYVKKEILDFEYLN